MVVLGIDPGYGTVGYGVIEIKGDYSDFSLLKYGAITTNAKVPFRERLNLIYEEVNKLILKFKPCVMVVEKLFFRNNQKTAIDVAQARGVILLSGAKNGVLLEEFTPLQVKVVVTGYGRAKKPEVMGTVKSILNLEKIPKPDDAADAIALAICYAKTKYKCKCDAEQTEIINSVVLKEQVV